MVNNVFWRVGVEEFLTVTPACCHDNIHMQQAQLAWMLMQDARRPLASDCHPSSTFSDSS